jgi:hypothetical protein
MSVMNSDMRQELINLEEGFAVYKDKLREMGGEKMNEDMYQQLLKSAAAILQLCREFPAHELMMYYEEHHSKDGNLTPSLMWSVNCESMHCIALNGNQRGDEALAAIQQVLDQGGDTNPRTFLDCLNESGYAVVNTR